ncbi:aldehyde dehydrogenase family protein [Mycobacterium sp.]|uniref:aldehyde dehydrogenase family protein n=1 Tax=Mycobacterium sp. TaxID=1785 RepID=UPI003D0AC5B1
MPVQAPDLDILPKTSLLIGDERLADSSGGQFQHFYAATGTPTMPVALAGAAEIDQAVQAARQAFPGWRALPVDQRREALLRYAQLLREHADELTRISMVDNSLPYLMASPLAPLAADAFAYNAGWADKIGGDVIPTWNGPSFDYTLEEPYGVVGIIIPWNGPVFALGMTLGPALAAGNCAVLKPPELAPFAAMRLGELFLEAGFPPGVVNVVTAGPAGGEALVRHPGVDKVHFTGSGTTAQKVLTAAQETLKPVALELGGKSANLIFADADLSSAALQGVLGMQGSGQGCINGTRVLVERPVYEEVLQLMAGILQTLEVGDPSVPSTFFGPVISDAAASRIMGVIDAAKNHGTRLVAGGERLGGDLANGYFISPTVFADVDNSVSIARDEIFGPVVAVLPFDDEDEAVHIANDNPFGLAGYIQTNDLKRAHRVASALEVGNIWVNGFLGIPTSVPFGGVKQSGWGRLGGRDGIREFTRPKNVHISL